MHHKLCIFFTTFIVLSTTHFCLAADPPPFKPGEKLHYSVYLGALSVGEVVFVVKPIVKINNIPAYHFVMTTETSPLLDAVLMLADSVESYSDAGMKHVLLYKEHHGDAALEDVTVTFDWIKREAQYCLGGKKYRPTALIPGAFDPLSVLYALRLFDLKGKGEISKPVSDGLHCVVARAKVLGKQKVQVESGEYDTYLVKPLLAEIFDIFQNISSANVKLWISADSRRVPVKLICEFPVVSIMAELRAIEESK